MADADITPLRVCVNCGVGFIGRLCKPCKKVRDARSYAKNSEKRLATNAKYRLQNKEKIKSLNADYYAANREKMDAYSRQYRADNLHRSRKLANAAAKRSRLADPNHKAKVAKYESENKEKFNAIRAKWRLDKRNSDPVFNLQSTIRNRMNEAIRNRSYTKRSKTLEVLGCDWDFLKSHIERQFLKGMTWEKMGSEIHIDHITPFASAKTEAEVISLSHFTNLRPMWAKENQSKGAKITHLI